MTATAVTATPELGKGCRIFRTIESGSSSLLSDQPILGQIGGGIFETEELKADTALSFKALWQITESVSPSRYRSDFPPTDLYAQFFGGSFSLCQRIRVIGPGEVDILILPSMAEPPAAYIWESSPALRALSTKFFDAAASAITHSTLSVSSEEYEGEDWSELEAELGSLLRTAAEEIFEDGIESAFSPGLAAYVAKYGNDGVSKSAEICLEETSNPEVVSETLRCLGEMEHPETHASRFWLLTRCLRHSSPLVRDAAAVGLAYLEDKAAVPYLQQAAGRERHEALRRDLEQIIHSLEA